MYYLLIIALLVALFAQINVKSTFSKYQEVHGSRGFTGADAARKILDDNGLGYISIEHISGELTDHYDPTANVIRLSDSVYDSTSVAAVGVAAHEAGHAVQHAVGYAPIKIRSAVIPLTQIGSYISYPLVLLGAIFGASSLIDLGIVLFTAVVFFQLITLPVEFNASSRALETLDRSMMLDTEELSGARKVLTAAALTYVAALFTALVNLLRLFAIRGNRR